jgi:hypothetical protein
LPALREAFDRLLGKPVAVVEQDVRTADFTKLIQEAWLEAVKSPPTIEAEREGGPTKIVAGMVTPVADDKSEPW